MSETPAKMEPTKTRQADVDVSAAPAETTAMPAAAFPGSPTHLDSVLTRFDSASGQRLLTALQRSAGNCQVGDLIQRSVAHKQARVSERSERSEHSLRTRTDARPSRGPTPATARESLLTLQRDDVKLPEETITGKPGVSRTLTDEDRTHLTNAKTSLRAATKDIEKLRAAIKELKSTGMPALDAVGDDYNETCGIYDAAYKSHLKVLGEGLKQEALEQAALAIVLDAALTLVPILRIESSITGALGKDAAGPMIFEAFGSRAEIVLRSAAATAQAGGKAAAKKTLGADGGKGGAGEGGAPDWAQRVKFYKDHSAAWKSVAMLLPAVEELGKVDTIVKVGDERIKGIEDANRTRTDATPAGIERAAKSLEDPAKTLGDKSPAIAGLVGEIQGIQAQVAALKPTPEDAEREIWIRWTAKLKGLLQRGILNAQDVTDHFHKLNLFEKLGIDIGDWFSFREEGLAAASAAALSRILDHRGRTFEVEADGQQVKGLIHLVPDLPPIPAQLTEPRHGPVEAILVSAKSFKGFKGGVLDFTFENMKSEKEMIYAIFAQKRVGAELKPVQAPV